MSELRRRAEDYLAMRRALGYKLHTHGRLLLQFIDYLEHAQARTVTVELAVAWARQPVEADPAWWADRLSVVRGFARHLHTLDPAAEVPPPDLLPGHHRRSTPYLYSDAEIAAIVQATHLLAAPLQAATFHALIGLLAVTGMRVGEAVALTGGNVDLRRGTLTVIKSKLDKSRQLPLHTSTVTALRDYARRRDDLLAAKTPTPNFFVSTNGTRLSVSAVDAVFARLLYHAGIQPPPGRRAPRVHDLRHSFTVATVLGWYRCGVDVQARLPSLSTYLGHVAPASTYWYLHAAPELLTLAANRLDDALRESP
jgi:integrase/recombinase XerD